MSKPEFTVWCPKDSIDTLSDVLGDIDLPAVAHIRATPAGSFVTRAYPDKGVLLGLSGQFLKRMQADGLIKKNVSLTASRERAWPAGACHALLSFDGVRYVPAIESAPNADAIARGIVALFWGRTDHWDRERLVEVMAELCIDVNDSGRGYPIEKALDEIVRAAVTVSEVPK